MHRKAAFHNLGCKVNAYETEAMQQLLEDAGYEIVPFAPGADVYIINTCSVTNIADRKSRQMLHRARKMNPGAVVVAAGCYTQTDTEGVRTDPAVDIILGNNCKKNIVEVLEDFERNRHSVPDGQQIKLPAEEERISMTDISHVKEYESLSISRTAEHVRAFIKVQDGCNQFCSYCIIPYARGRVRSRRADDVLEEVRTLSAKGYQEVVFTGIHLSSYGSDFKDEKADLLSLIQEVQQITGIERIRLGSLEPRIITEEFVRTLASIPKICPHFHLSLQSGCADTLKRMNRHYTKEEYREKCALLRKYFDSPALTTDVITGFPMETEENFEESYAFVREIHFYETHVFPYSRREGTKAAAMSGQLTEAVKKQRSEQLLILNEKRKTEYEQSFIGRPLSVLLEEEITVKGVPYLAGHSKEYLTAAVPKTRNFHINDICIVTPKSFLEPHILLCDQQDECPA